MKTALLLAATVGIAAVAAQPAMADSYTFSVNYFKHAPGGDFEQYIDGTYSNMVQSALGPNGMPVINPGYGGPAITELNGFGEIQWWTPNGTTVVSDGSGIATSPFYDGSFYPSQGGGSNDTSGWFQTAIFSGDITLASDSSVTFTFGGDDDVFLFVDNLVVGQQGGVHGYTAAPVTTGTLLAGTHQFKLFFADRHTTGSVLNFSIDTEGLVVTPSVPEPGTWAMMLIGFGALGMSMRRRKTAVSFA